jgi:hypothetical protein
MIGSPWRSLDCPSCSDDQRDRRNGDRPNPERWHASHARSAYGGNQPVDCGEGNECHEKDADLPSLDPNVEAEQRERDVVDEKAAEIIREARSVDEPEHAGQYRTISSEAPSLYAISN